MNPILADGEPWFVHGIGWESRRLTPIHEKYLDPDVPFPATYEERIAELDGLVRTPGMVAAQRAGDAVMDAFVHDAELRRRFAEKGVDRVNVTPAFVDPGWEPTFASPRYRFKRKQRFLDVDVWYFYDGPVEGEAFGRFVDEVVRADLEAWLNR